MDIQKQVVEAFQVEHREQVAGIRAILSGLEAQPLDAADPRLAEAFRMAHTLKGGARVCAIKDVETLGHCMESLFAGARDGALTFDRKIGEAIGKALDTIEDLMVAYAAGSVPPSATEALAEIERALGKSGAPSKLTPPSPEAPPPAPAPPEAAPASAAERRPALPREIETLRVHAQQLDEVMRAADALLGVCAFQESLAAEIGRVTAEASRLHEECNVVRAGAGRARRSTAPEGGTGRAARRLEFATQRARGMVRQLRSIRGLHSQAAWTLGAAAGDLKRAIQQTRLVAAEDALQGLGPMVRNLARDLGKQVEFRASGLDLQADRMVLQPLKDPLIHALRNAVVHGIETPAERAAQRKDERGQVLLTLRAQGSSLRVRIEDNGRGIDLAQVAHEADRLGLGRTSGDPEANRDRLLRLLFRPGFSTAKSVTELAGRGMGLSVVQETISRLRGSVRVESTPGQGTVLEFLLPLFVSAERLLLMSCAGQTVALPMRSVSRVLRIKCTDVQSVDDRQMIIIDHAPIPLLKLAPTYENSAFSSIPTEGDHTLSIALLKNDDGAVGFVADAFLSERTALVRELDGRAAAIPHYGGAIVLEDGAVVPVIDPAGVAASAAAPGPRECFETPEGRKLPRVLVVDDSFTTRTLEKGILETNGYEVRVAVDGVEALMILRSEPIGVVVADVQMPRMDGLTLLSQVRGDAQLRSLPFILVTSLDEPEDRRRGLELGANAYVVKRQFDHQTLLDAVQRFL